MDYQNCNFPLGLAAAGLLGDDLHLGNGGMSEAQKEELIFKYKDTDSKKEKERIKEAMSSDDEVRSIFSGPGIG